MATDRDQQLLQYFTIIRDTAQQGITLLQPSPVNPVVHVKAGQPLQPVIDAAQANTLILLDPAGTWSTIVLRGASGCTLAADRVTPLSTARIDPSTPMPKLVATIDTPALMTGDSAQGWIVQGLEIVGHPDSNNHTVSLVGPAKNIVIDRCYIHGDAAKGAKVGVVLNNQGAAMVTGCYISDFKRAGQDTQAIAGAQGSGPYSIVGNYLSAAGENILFGGDDPKIQGLVPSDITISNNYLFKPLAWQQEPWTVKNLLELKNARRVTITGNTLENCWQSGQVGYAIVLTVRNQDGNAPWSTIEDVALSDNHVRNVGAGVNILGKDDLHRSQQMKRVTIQGLTIEGLAALPGAHRTVQMAAADQIAFDGWQVQGAKAAINSFLSLYGQPTTNFHVANCLFQEGEYGIVGDGTALGVPSLEKYTPGYTWSGVTVVKGLSGRTIPYPPGTTVVP